MGAYSSGRLLEGVLNRTFRNVILLDAIRGEPASDDEMSGKEVWYLGTGYKVYPGRGRRKFQSSIKKFRSPPIEP